MFYFLKAICVSFPNIEFWVEVSVFPILLSMLLHCLLAFIVFTNKLAKIDHCSTMYMCHFPWATPQDFFLNFWLSSRTTLIYIGIVWFAFALSRSLSFLHLKICLLPNWLMIWPLFLKIYLLPYSSFSFRNSNYIYVILYPFILFLGPLELYFVLFCFCFSK